MQTTGFQALANKECFLNYLEDFDASDLADKLDKIVMNLGFSREEAKMSDIEGALKLTIDVLAKQGGKIVLIIGNEMEYAPKSTEGDSSKRSHFYATDLSFSRLAAEMHKYLLATDLYLFGHKGNKNLGSIGELTRLSGGEISYYETVDPDDGKLTSIKILQRLDVQHLQA
jgi:hypothetical protein